MSDRQLGPDEPVAPDDPALPPEVWDSLFWACVLPSDDDGSPLALAPPRPPALPPAQDAPPPPVPERVAVEVVAQRVEGPAPRRPRRRAIVHGLRSSAALRAAVVTLVLGSAVLVASVSDGDGPRSDLVRSGAPATVRPTQPDAPVTTAPVPVLQEGTHSTAPDVTSTTAAPTTVAPTTTARVAPPTTPAAPRTTQARTSRTTAPAATTRPTSPATTALATGPACGFAPGSSVDVILNGKPLGEYKADDQGCVHMPR